MRAEGESHLPEDPPLTKPGPKTLYCQLNATKKVSISVAQRRETLDGVWLCGRAEELT